MKVKTVLSKAYDILGYMRRRRKERLYQQWVESGDLAHEALPKEEVAEDIIPTFRREQLILPVLYGLCGFALGILCTCLVILFVQSC